MSLPVPVPFQFQQWLFQTIEADIHGEVSNLQPGRGIRVLSFENPDQETGFAPLTEQRRTMKALALSKLEELHI